MKKFIVLISACIICLICCISANAIDFEPAKRAGAMAIATEEAIEVGIIDSIVGRAGTAASGAKGIVFEALFSCKQNVKDLFSGAKTVFTKSSTAPQVDLVTKENGKVIARYQCKDTPNSISHTLKQVESGKYHQSRMVGTSETADAFNEGAAKQGISKTMKDSGISTDTTSRIADKFHGNLPSFSSLASYALKAGGIGAIASGSICLVESLCNGDDTYDTVANVTVGSTEGFLSSSIAAVAGEVTTALVISCGASEMIAIAVPVITSFGVGYLVYWLAEQAINEDAVSEAVKNIFNFVAQNGIAFSTEVRNFCKGFYR